MNSRETKGANEILRKTSALIKEHPDTPRICPKPPESGPRILISNSRRKGVTADTATGEGCPKTILILKISPHGICRKRGSYFKNITLHRNFLILKTRAKGNGYAKVLSKSTDSPPPPLHWPVMIFLF